MENRKLQTGEVFMKFFRTTEKINELTPDDRSEIFRTLPGNYFNKRFPICINSSK